MNKTTRIYLAILLVLVLAFVINKYVSNPTEKRVKFFDVDSMAIAKIIISNSTDTLHLEKEGVNWIITYPIRCEIDPNYFDNFYSNVIPVETSSIPVSVSSSSHNVYSVSDSLGTAITILDADDGILDESIIGKSSNYNFSHGRKNGEDKVYQLNNNISYNIHPSLKRWRNKELLAIEEENLISVEMQSASGNLLITRTDSLWTVTDGSDFVTLDDNNGAFRSIKNDLKKLMTSDFIDNDFEAHAESIANPDLLVTITDANNNIINLKFASYEEKKYLMQLNDQQDPLYIVYEHMVNHFLKDLDGFRE